MIVGSQTVYEYVYRSAEYVYGVMLPNRLFAVSAETNS